MDKQKLVWTQESQKKIFDSRVFSVRESYCRSPNDTMYTYTVIDAPDWAMVIPVLDTEQGKKFLMVKQWRHGSQDISLEFPGGVSEKDEEPEMTAARELREETGYVAGNIEKLGEFYPNPAIMSNKIHFFLASDMKEPLKQELDPDEFVEVEILPWEDVLRSLGTAPYSHALTGTAISLYLQKKAAQ